MATTASERQIISRALVLCGKQRVNSPSEDREDIAIALEMLPNVVKTALATGYFYDGEQEAPLTIVPEPDRKVSFGVSYYRPTNLISIRSIYEAPTKPTPALYGDNCFTWNNYSSYLCPIEYKLVGNFIVVSIESSNLRVFYTGTADVYSDLFIRYTSAKLAVEIVESVGSLESVNKVTDNWLRTKAEVAALTFDSDSWPRGNSYFPSIQRYSRW